MSQVLHYSFPPRNILIVGKETHLPFIVLRYEFFAPVYNGPSVASRPSVRALVAFFYILLNDLVVLYFT